MWGLQKHLGLWVSKESGGDIPAENLVISRVQPTTGALYGDAEKEGSKGLLCSDTQNVSLG